jgi:hypothetical protein
MYSVLCGLLSEFHMIVVEGENVDIDDAMTNCG